MNNADVQDPAIILHIRINAHFKKLLPSQAASLPLNNFHFELLCKAGEQWSFLAK
ncbi:hypothetical protein [Providencia vermicola]|uniref:hypothetical protein n=1 Tax=Providencia vermicola TaxID=333965 RepID=UPI00220DC14F|nr:hypothetical protein NFC79_13235 [Providencia stuartii]